jgi:HEPN domain-containing protein
MNEPHIEAQRWLRQAQADLAVVRTLYAAGHHAAACFHSQQAAEKALKAVIFAHGARVVLGHSVRELARQCEAYDTTFAGVADGAALSLRHTMSTVISSETAGRTALSPCLPSSRPLLRMPESPP